MSDTPNQKRESARLLVKRLGVAVAFLFPRPPPAICRDPPPRDSGDDSRDSHWRSARFPSVLCPLPGSGASKDLIPHPSPVTRHPSPLTTYLSHVGREAVREGGRQQEPRALPLSGQPTNHAAWHGWVLIRAIFVGHRTTMHISHVVDARTPLIAQSRSSPPHPLRPPLRVRRVRRRCRTPAESPPPLRRRVIGRRQLLPLLLRQRPPGHIHHRRRRHQSHSNRPSNNNPR